MGRPIFSLDDAFFCGQVAATATRREAATSCRHQTARMAPRHSRRKRALILKTSFCNFSSCNCAKQTNINARKLFHLPSIFVAKEQSSKIRIVNKAGSDWQEQLCVQRTRLKLRSVHFRSTNSRFSKMQLDSCRMIAAHSCTGGNASTVSINFSNCRGSVSAFVQRVGPLEP